MEQIALSTTKKFELVNITKQISQQVGKANVQEGICLLFVPHASAALLINEDEPGFRSDIETLVGLWIPQHNWEHNKVDNNATAHLGSSLIGQERMIPISEGKLVLGTWQEIFFVELDGPRQNRHVIVQALGK